MQQQQPATAHVADEASPPPPPRPLSGLLDEFLGVLAGILPEEGEAAVQPNPHALLYCERFVEFLTDLLSQVRATR